MKKILTCFMMLASSNAFALNAWVNDNTTLSPMVISERGNFLIAVTYAKDQYENVYLYPLHDKTDCTGRSDAGSQAKSVQFNGVLVQMGEQCLNGVHGFYPTTMAGRNFVINQFFRSTTVTVVQGNFRETISAQGFSRTMNTFRNANNNTGGL